MTQGSRRKPLLQCGRAGQNGWCTLPRAWRSGFSSPVLPSMDARSIGRRILSLRSRGGSGRLARETGALPLGVSNFVELAAL